MDTVASGTKKELFPRGAVGIRAGWKDSIAAVSSWTWGRCDVVINLWVKDVLVFPCFFVCFVFSLLPGYTWTFTMSLVCYKNEGLNRHLASSLYIWQGKHNTLIHFAWGSGKHKWTKAACLPHFCRHEPDVGMLSFRAALRALFSTCSIWMYDRSWCLLMVKKKKVNLFEYTRLPATCRGFGIILATWYTDKFYETRKCCLSNEAWSISELQLCVIIIFSVVSKVSKDHFTRLNWNNTPLDQRLYSKDGRNHCDTTHWFWSADCDALLAFWPPPCLFFFF